MLSWFEKKIHPFPAEEAGVTPATFLAFIWAASKGARGYILWVGLLSAVIGAFEALLFAALGIMVDWVAAVPPGELWEREGNTLLLMLAAVIASVGIVALESFIMRQTLWGNLPMRLRWNLHRLMLSQSMGFFQNEFSGRITSKVMQTALAVRDVWMVAVEIAAFVIIYFVTMIVTVGGFDKVLLLPFAVWFVFYLLALRWFVPRFGVAAQAYADATSFMTGRITDAYTNIATVKLFSHAGRESEYARDSMREYLQANHVLMRKMTGIEIVNHALSMFLIVAAVGTALWLWNQGAVGVGALAAVGAMTLRLNGMSHWIAWETARLFEHVGTVRDGIQIFSRCREVTDCPGATELSVSNGDIRFENVCFSYDGNLDNPIIDTFSLHIRPGEKIGLVGRSGAGKTTLVALLLRFHDVGTGRILIDGQDIALVTQESLRAAIGMVTQDTSLLHRSVRDNIMYGRPDAPEEDVRAAAEQAEADRFIEGLADAQGRTGLDVLVGERGVKLSGGQRQRIAIARVMLKNAPILLLDEATSALDSEVEAAIQDNLYRLMEGKTVVSIAHRLSTIAAMDRLVVMEKGKIAEVGDHLSLLEKGGVYAQLWERQSGGFLGVDE